MPEKLTIPGARSEPRDAGGRFIAGAFFLLLTSVAVVGLICWAIFPNAPHTQLVPYPVPNYPSPELQGDPHQDLVRFYRQEIDGLNSIGWVDREQGIVHIPIEQAMRKIAAQGIPGWPAAAANANAGARP